VGGDARAHHARAEDGYALDSEHRFGYRLCRRAAEKIAGGSFRSEAAAYRKAPQASSDRRVQLF
jgi:hypothetical protein